MPEEAESLPDVQAVCPRWRKVCRMCRGLPETENGLPGAAGTAGAEIFFSGRSGRPFSYYHFGDIGGKSLTERVLQVLSGSVGYAVDEFC